MSLNVKTGVLFFDHNQWLVLDINYKQNDKNNTWRIILFAGFILKRRELKEAILSQNIRTSWLSVETAYVHFILLKENICKVESYISLGDNYTMLMSGTLTTFFPASPTQNPPSYSSSLTPSFPPSFLPPFFSSLPFCPSIFHKLFQPSI